MSAPKDRQARVAVLGATGAVGQRLVQMLAVHPWFELVAVMASQRSQGRSYGDATHWLLPGGIPSEVAAMTVLPPQPQQVAVDLVFSALDPAVADNVEPAFRDAGVVVVSNTRSFRDDPEVPLVIPEINPDHLALVSAQRRRHGGAIVTNPNCSTIGLALAIEPLRQAFGIRQVLVTTLQAVSGAGYPGTPSLDVMDNILPLIPGEEAKLRSEPNKIFGHLAKNAGTITQASLTVSAQCNRVAVREGHLLSISLELERKAGLEEARAALAGYRSPLADSGLPTAPARPVVVSDGAGRPQPVLDRDRAGGMAVTVGRLQSCPVLDLRYVALVHNTIRGAAGGTILIAELLVAQGLVTPQNS